MLLREYWNTNKTLPPVNALSELFDMRSTASVWGAVRRMIASGHLRRLVGNKLAPGENFFQPTPVLDATFTDGLPTPKLNAQKLASLMLGTERDTVAYEVADDALVAQGISKGMLALVNSHLPITVGDIIAVADAGRLKFRIVRATTKLRDGITLLGVVTAIVRVTRPS